MKRTICLLAFAAILLSSCSIKGESPCINSRQAIGFGTYVGTTRTTAITTANITSFGVYGYYSDGAPWTSNLVPNFMFNQKVEGSNASGFTYSPVKYWPNEQDDKLSFFAYAPYMNGTNGISENSLNITPGAPSIKYEMPSSEDSQADILWATPVLNMAGRDQGASKVLLKFNHSLSALGMKIRYLAELQDLGGTVGDALASGSKVYLNSVTFSSDFPSSGVLNLQDGSWSDVRSSASRSYTRSFGEAAQGLEVGKENSDILSGDDLVLMIPRGSMEIAVSVTYTVITDDASLKDGKSVIVNTISKSTTINASNGSKTDLILVLGLTSVKFDAPEVSVWEFSSSLETEIDLPQNNA